MADLGKAAYNLANQNNTNKANISDFFVPVVSKNLLDQRQMIVGDINTGNGTVTANPNSQYIYTPQIGVISGRKVFMSATDAQYGFVGAITFYRVFKWDANQTFLGYDTVNWVSNYTVPNGTTYIKLMFASSSWNNAGKIYQLEYDQQTTAVKYSNYALNPNLAIPKLESNNNIINCWGDSLTEGTGATSSATAYPAILGSLIGGGFTVRNLGIGGEGSASIAMRQSGIPIYVDPFTIAADTSTAVTVTFSNQALETYSVSLLNHAGNTVDSNYSNLAMNPVTIAGIQGTLARPSVSNNNYTFTRKTAGTSVALNRPTFVDMYSNENYRNDIVIIWVGTNDTSWTTQQLMQVQEQMVKHLKHDRFIIVSLTCLSRFPDIVMRNTLMSQYWGKHFLDIRNYLLNYGLSDAGITPTTQDNTDISNGEIPTSLRFDSVHLNDSGYNIVANQVYKKGVDLGYWR